MARTNGRFASKLVRDGIPADRLAEKPEHLTLLTAKLFEEAAEVARSTQIHNLTEELGDVIDVCESIAILMGIDLDRVHEWRKAKTERRGGFLFGAVQDGI